MNPADVEPRAPVGDEHEARGSRAEELFSTAKVLRQCGQGRSVDWHESPSTQLRSPDRQYTLHEVDIVELQVQRLRDAQAGDAEQAQ